MSKITGTVDFGAIEVTILIVTGLTCYVLVRSFRSCLSKPLKGPSSTFRNFFFGVMPYLRSAPDAGAIYEDWASEYGEVFSVPAFLGSRNIVFTDPKTIAHFAARETYGYVATPHSKHFTEKLFGRGLFWAEGDSHKRQRRELNPAFSNAAIKT
ncbi:Cytochrome P450 [Mycena venus]|uniref:Cytochrome P450 n=1 Tax=Mycena venus TaxID=2733690 RepID=A0A8H6XH10_9AGAR|nr:Cytochrome P450 [Mycena venus]